MHIAGGHNGLTEPVGNGYYFSVYILKCRLIFNRPLSDKEHIISVRLDFQIIVKRGDFKYLLITFSVKYRPVNLTLFTGAADNNTLSKFLNNGSRRSGTSVKMFKVRLRNYFIKVL